MKRYHVVHADSTSDTQKAKEACAVANVDFVYARYGFVKIEQYEREIDSFVELT